MRRGIVLVAITMMGLAACAPAGPAGEPPPASPARSAPPSPVPQTGAVPQAMPTRVGTVTLPPGHVIAGPAGSSRSTGGAAATIWVSDESQDNAGELAAQLIAAFPQTGIWPVVTQAGDQIPGLTLTTSGTAEPWWPVYPGLSEDGPALADPAGQFATWWDDNVTQNDTDDHAVATSFGVRFPGLGHPGGPAQASAITGGVSGWRGHLTLVRVTRPADVPAVLGWSGAINYRTPRELSFALRSWEDRYGATLIGLGVDYVELAVAKPPRTGRAATVAAAEHFAVCPDTLSQNDDDLTPVEYARSLIGSPRWFCWWD